MTDVKSAIENFLMDDAENECAEDPLVLCFFVPKAKRFEAGTIANLLLSQDYPRQPILVCCTDATPGKYYFKVDSTRSGQFYHTGHVNDI